MRNSLGIFICGCVILLSPLVEVRITFHIRGVARNALQVLVCCHFHLAPPVS